jgi:hypothetical protein
MNSIKSFVKRILERAFLSTNQKLDQLKLLNQVNTGLSRAAAVAGARNIDSTNPTSWEFGGFSQNGEDGIIDYLVGRLKSSNRYFIEIGASNGIDNNTAWLAHGRRFSGLMIDGNMENIKTGEQVATVATNILCMFVNQENISKLKELALHRNPDVFSLDIDGTDYYIVKAILEGGFKPKIFIVEYNSAFGPAESKTVAYTPDFIMANMHPTQLYYGVSVCGWKTLFAKHGYQFVTVDANGVNAVFIDPTAFDQGFTSQLKGLDFVENFYQLKKFGYGWQEQSKLLEGVRFFSIV